MTQEPFCYVYKENGEEFFAPKDGYSPADAIPLYDHPQREWVGLTDAEVERIKLDGRDLEFVSMTALHRFARDIQAKLKEKNT